jgi:DNA-binding NarL/FixJ family response regulator
MGNTYVLEPDAAREMLRRGAPLHLDAWRSCLTALDAEAALARADWTTAADLASAVLAATGEVGDETRCGALRVLALVRVRRGDPGAWPLLDEALDLARDARQMATVAAARAEAAWIDGRADDIAAETEAAFRRALAADEDWHAAELARWRLRAGIDDAVPPAAPTCAYDAALELTDADGCAGLQRAFHALRTLGAHGAAGRVGRRLADHGVRGLPRGPYSAARGNPGDLTRRELEVLRLVGEGLRNADISERLVVAPKTVDHHVSAILRKLNVPNRTAAAQWLQRAA